MFKILDPICAPTKGSRYSAGIDLYARETIVIVAGETAKIPLGVCIDLACLPAFGLHEFKMSHFLELHPRSSLRAKGLIAGVGVIDLDFTLELQMIVHNPYTNKKDTVGITRSDGMTVGVEYIDPRPFQINKGDKVAQILLKEHKGYLLGVESNEKRIGGFGSSGNR